MHIKSFCILAYPYKKVKRDFILDQLLYGDNVVTTQLSEKWKNWIAELDERTCKQCVDKNGKIYPIYEADINYMGGYRDGDRIVFSNDGLIFVTYNHYETFYEIVGEISNG